MKNAGKILTVMLLLLTTYLSNAQEPSTFFVADWNVLIIGTPSGDAKVVFHLERVDGKLTGEVRSDQGDPVKIDRVEEKENSINVFYATMGYDLNVFLEKVDENNLKGNLLGMFDVKAERASE